MRDNHRLGDQVLFELSEHLLDAGGGMGMHSHPEGQLYAIAKGLMVITMAHETWVVAPGQIGWIPPDLQHGARVHGALSGWVGHLAPDLCSRLPPRVATFGQSTLSAEILGRLRKSKTLAHDDPRPIRLLEVLLDELDQMQLDAMRLPFPKSPRLAEIARAIADMPSQPASLDALASQACMSRRNFARQFRAETGLSVLQWRDAARMRQAATLLTEGHGVTETAHRLGYGDTSRFIEKFREAFQTTPKKYARRGKDA